jgi:hypothetical protein
MPARNAGRLRRAGLVLLAVTVAATLTACGRSAAPQSSRPDRVEAIAGSPFKRIVLTPEGASRIGIQTSTVRRARIDPRGRMGTVIPYGAVLYDDQGRAFTYTRPLPLQYVRHPIAIDHIAGGLAFLSSGPPAGTRVVTVGAEELFGAELGVAE